MARVKGLEPSTTGSTVPEKSPAGSSQTTCGQSPTASRRAADGRVQTPVFPPLETKCGPQVWARIVGHPAYEFGPQNDRSHRSGAPLFGEDSLRGPRTIVPGPHSSRLGPHLPRRGRRRNGHREKLRDISKTALLRGVRNERAGRPAPPGCGCAAGQDARPAASCRARTPLGRGLGAEAACMGAVSWGASMGAVLAHLSPLCRRPR